MGQKIIEPVNIGGVKVGDGYPTVFMAEIGAFFNKDVDLACSYIDAAVKAGVPVMKSEVLHDPEVCLKNTGLQHRYAHATGSTIEDYRQLMERKVVSLDGYRKIYSFCKELGVPFVASVYDIEGIDFFVEVGGSAIKIARDNINNIPLIRYAARTGLPIIFDAGVVYLEEVARAVKLAQDEGAGGVIINHHPGMNPAPPEVHNMRMMQLYKETFGVPVGLACHYRGDEILYLAIGMGANILEKGVVEDPDRVEQDIISAAKLSEVGDIVRKVNNCWQAIGKTGVRYKEPRDFSTRKGLIAKRRISKGEPLSLENLRFAFPPLGVSVEHWDLILGKKAARNIQSDAVINWQDIQIEDFDKA